MSRTGDIQDCDWCGKRAVCEPAKAGSEYLWICATCADEHTTKPKLVRYDGWVGGAVVPVDPTKGE